MIKLTSFFSNRMILQRGFEENRIWGYTAPGAKLSLSLVASEHAEGDGEPSHFESIRADMQGYFSFLLPFMDAGGPWRIVIEDEEERKVLEDVYFGDVFLLGGQSNMELPLSFPSLREEYGDELSGADYGLIRQFEVPKEYDFNEKRKMLTEGKWVKASGEELLTFSAAGFFAAKAIYEKKKIPIGLYQTAVGGTPVKAWCAPDTIKELGIDEQELSECADSAYVAKTIEEETARDKGWRKRAMEPFQTEREEEWREFFLPALFLQTELRDFIGSLCFTRSFSLTEEQKKSTAVLHFGAMIDADEI
ncbi:MAG: hypothetical protein IJ733_12600, partial [Lachnospiraceae bacterium]|nr:hypothetical protein [Lachnospiraceae bacterium]